MQIRYILIFGLLIFILACNSPKKLTKKGLEHEQSGYYEDAVNFYIQALQKDKTYPEANQQLRLVSRTIFGNLSSDFFNSFNKGEYEKSIADYQKMLNFMQKVNPYNVNLSIPEQYEEDYLEAKAIFLEQQYLVVNNLMMEEKFAEAETQIKKIQAIDPNYKQGEINDLKNIAVLEPFYRLGKAHLVKGKYRAAYNDFTKIIERDDDYKDTKFLREQALEKALYNIAIYDFVNGNANDKSGDVIKSRLVNEVLRSGNPFVRFIDRANMQTIMQEQKLALNGAIDTKSAIRVGEILGAKAILDGKVIKVTNYQGELVSERKKAYLQSAVKKYNAQERREYYDTVFEKISYTHNTRRNTTEIIFQFQLISLETGQILLSKTITQNEESNVAYSTYPGDVNRLIPGHWENKLFNSTNDYINTNRNAVETFRKEFSANQQPLSVNQLMERNYDLIVADMLKDILNFNPENVR
jgi:tetratricopeptide (TPR) repeat protein